MYDGYSKSLFNFSYLGANNILYNNIIKQHTYSKTKKATRQT